MDTWIGRCYHIFQESQTTATVGGGTMAPPFGKAFDREARVKPRGHARVGWPRRQAVNHYRTQVLVLTFYAKAGAGKYRPGVNKEDRRPGAAGRPAESRGSCRAPR